MLLPYGRPVAVAWFVKDATHVALPGCSPVQTIMRHWRGWIGCAAWLYKQQAVPCRACVLFAVGSWCVHACVMCRGLRDCMQQGIEPSAKQHNGAHMYAGLPVGRGASGPPCLAASHALGQAPRTDLAWTSFELAAKQAAVLPACGCLLCQQGALGPGQLLRAVF